MPKIRALLRRLSLDPGDGGAESLLFLRVSGLAEPATSAGLQNWRELLSAN